MKLIDTHAHLQFAAYDADREKVVKRNSEELAAIINAGTSTDASEKGIALANKASNFYASVGVHPHHVGQWNDQTLGQLENLAKKEKVVAIGEIGLDNHPYQGYPEPDLKKQTQILIPQIELAQKRSLPILFHCRDAYEELYEEIKQYRGKITGLMHCFMGTKEAAKKFLDLGLYISFAGNITYKGNNYIREAAKETPLDRILVETDSPYLPPETLRGTRNEPINVKIVAKTLAKARNIENEIITSQTAENAKRLFLL